jgi:hypothetical protein
MDLTYATIVVLASMMFVLSGMVGYLYWQQTRLQQNINSLSIVVSTLVNPPEADPEPITAEPTPVVSETEAEAEEEEEEEDEEEDDRVSVENVTEPPAKETSPPIDIDELQSKTAAQLREILTQKGIPFSKRDSKTVLIELLKATA